MLHADVGAGYDATGGNRKFGAVITQTASAGTERLRNRADPVELRSGAERGSQGRMASRAKRTRPLPVATQM